jgi:hypothetical protein
MHCVDCAVGTQLLNIVLSSLWRPRWVPVRFFVNKVALWHVFTRLLRVVPVIIIPCTKSENLKKKKSVLAVVTARTILAHSVQARSHNSAQRLLSSSCTSVCPSAWNDSTSTGLIFVIFDIWIFLENLSRKSKFHLNLTRIMGTLPLR